MSSSLKRTLSCWGRCINAKMTFLSWHGTRLVLQSFLLSMSLKLLWTEPPSPNTMHNHAVDWPHSPANSQVLYLSYHAPKLSGFCCKTTSRYSVRGQFPLETSPSRRAGWHWGKAGPPALPGPKPVPASFAHPENPHTTHCHGLGFVP